LKPLPPIKLKGHAITSDPNKEWRDELDIQLQTYHLLNGIQEIVDDIVDGVKTPPKPPPDLTDPKVCQQVFERQNKDMNLYYNPMVLEWWWNLSRNLEDKLKGIIDNVEWDLKVTSIGDRIKELTDAEDKKNFQRRYDEYVELSKVRPFHRSPYFDEMSEFLRVLAKEIPK
jgi:hypothetical protein